MSAEIIERTKPMGVLDQASETTSLSMDHSRKRKSCDVQNGPKTVALDKCKEYRNKFDLLDVRKKLSPQNPTNGSKKGCLNGKRVLENSRCNHEYCGSNYENSCSSYRCVGQSRCGKRVSELNELQRCSSLLRSRFDSADEAALDMYFRASLDPRNDRLVEDNSCESTATSRYSANYAADDLLVRPTVPVIDHEENQNFSVDELFDPNWLLDVLDSSPVDGSGNRNDLQYDVSQVEYPERRNTLDENPYLLQNPGQQFRGHLQHMGQSPSNIDDCSDCYFTLEDFGFDSD